MGNQLDCVSTGRHDLPRRPHPCRSVGKIYLRPKTHVPVAILSIHEAMLQPGEYKGRSVLILTLPHTLVSFGIDDQVIIQGFEKSPIVNPFGRKHPVYAIQNGEDVIENPRYCEHCGTLSKTPIKSDHGQIIGHECQVCSKVDLLVEAA